LVKRFTHQNYKVKGHRSQWQSCHESPGVSGAEPSPYPLTVGAGKGEGPASAEGIRSFLEALGDSQARAIPTNRQRGTRRSRASAPENVTADFGNGNRKNPPLTGPSGTLVIAIICRLVESF